MGIHPAQLRDFIITPVLVHLNMHSPAAVNLLMLTAAAESQMGRFVRQMGGPALGIFQMEPLTHDDIWTHYITPNVATVLSRWLPAQAQIAELAHEQLIGNIWYAAAMCRLHYRRVSAPLPEATDTSGLAAYWKQHYNTPKGRGTIAHALGAIEPHKAVLIA